MPKEVTDIKKFLHLTKAEEKLPAQAGKDKKNVPRMKHQKVLYIKKIKNVTKFKLRGKRYLYTFKTSDQTKSAKLIQSLPPSLQRIDVDKEKKQPKKGKK